VSQCSFNNAPQRWGCSITLSTYCALLLRRVNRYLSAVQIQPERFRSESQIGSCSNWIVYGCALHPLCMFCCVHGLSSATMCKQNDDVVSYDDRQAITWCQGHAKVLAGFCVHACFDIVRDVTAMYSASSWQVDVAEVCVAASACHCAHSHSQHDVLAGFFCLLWDCSF
jgi:hypothetical protein